MAKETYTAKKWDEKALTAELIKRGFDEADLVDLAKGELVAQLKADDAETAAGAGEKPDADEDADAPEGDDDAETVKGDSKKADIIKGEEYVRTFSLSVHGKEYKALAEDFVAKHPMCTIAKAGQVKSFVVAYRVENKKTGVWGYLYEKFNDGAKALAFANDLPGNIKKTIKFK